MLKTCAELARLKKVSRAAVDKFLKKNDIQPGGRKGKLNTYEVYAEPLQTYMREYLERIIKKPAQPEAIDCWFSFPEIKIELTEKGIMRHTERTGAGDWL